MTNTQFKDRHGTTWDLKLTLGKALLVDRSDFSLYLPEGHKRVLLTRFDKETIQLILTDNALLFAVIGVIVRGQFRDNLKDRLGFISREPSLSSDVKTLFKVEEKLTLEHLNDFSPEDRELAFQTAFADSISGETIEPARTAFVESLGDFFPAAKTVLSTFLMKTKEYQAMGLKRLAAAIPMMDQKVEELLDQEFKTLQESLTVASPPSPPSSDSAPASGSPSPSENSSSATMP